MKSYEEIRNNNQNGTFYAGKSDGKKYDASKKQPYNSTQQPPQSDPALF